MFLAEPRSGIQVNALLCTMIMFALIVMGIWTDVGLLIALGIFVYRRDH